MISANMLLIIIFQTLPEDELQGEGILYIRISKLTSEKYTLVNFLKLIVNEELWGYYIETDCWTIGEWSSEFKVSPFCLLINTQTYFVHYNFFLWALVNNTEPNYYFSTTNKNNILLFFFVIRGIRETSRTFCDN